MEKKENKIFISARKVKMNSKILKFLSMYDFIQKKNCFKSKAKPKNKLEKGYFHEK